MDIAIDGSKVTVPLSSNPSVGDLFAQVLAWCGSRRRVLISVSIDGRRVDPAGREGEVLPAGAVLEASTSSPGAFASRMLADLRAHLGSLSAKHEEAGRLTVAGSYEPALKIFGACFQGWAVLTTALQELIRLLQVDLREVRCGEEPAEGVILKVAAALARFQEAFRKRDAVLLGDLAQYELKPLLGDWGRILEILSGLAEARP